jgi:3-hydroxy-3-methylglutaryl CoA synthase
VHIYAKGDRVSHGSYGSGTIFTANSIHTVIDFDEHGHKTFVTNLVQLEKTSSPAPVRVKAVRRVKKAATAAPTPTAADAKPKAAKK